MKSAENFEKAMEHKKRSVCSDASFCLKFGLVAFLHSGKAIAAINGTIAGGLEGNLCFLTAVCASGGEIFLRLSCGVLSCVAASFASLGLVLETFLSVEFLFTCGENEFLATVFAY